MFSKVLPKMTENHETAHYQRILKKWASFKKNCCPQTGKYRNTGLRHALRQQKILEKPLLERFDLPTISKNRQ